MSQGSPGAPAAFVGTRAPSAPPKSSYAGYTGIPAGWMPDPSGKHHERYWSGSEWTDHVTRRGNPLVDPLPAGGPSRTEAEHPSDDTGRIAARPSWSVDGWLAWLSPRAQVAVCAGGSGDADHGLVEMLATHRAGEDRVPEVEDAAVGRHLV